MNLLPKVKGKQPLRTVGELRSFIADLDDSVLLTSFQQYWDETCCPVVAEICEDNRGEEGIGEPPGHWLNHKQLHISGYEQYEGDPALEDAWKDVVKPPADNPQSERYYIPAEEGPGQKEYGAPILRFIEREGDDYWYGEFYSLEVDADLSKQPGFVYTNIKRGRIHQNLYEFLAKQHTPDKK